jgi:hypothetical protein
MPSPGEEHRRRSEREIDTDRIRRTIDQIQSRQTPPPAPPHECDQEQRLTSLEKAQDDQGSRIRDCEAALSDGRVQFAEVRKDLSQIMVSLVELKAQIAGTSPVWEKIRDAAIFWAVPLIGGAILWAIVRSGQVPGVHP